MIISKAKPGYLFPCYYCGLDVRPLGLPREISNISCVAVPCSGFKRHRLPRELYRMRVEDSVYGFTELFLGGNQSPSNKCYDRVSDLLITFKATY